MILLKIQKLSSPLKFYVDHFLWQKDFLSKTMTKLLRFIIFDEILEQSATAIDVYFADDPRIYC